MADLQGRSLTWAFVMYPESMPSNWLEEIRSWRLCGAISPLHDRDINADNTPKKPHYHVLLKFSSKKSLHQVLPYVKKMGFNGGIECIDSYNGYMRYLVHRDNPEKAQYSIDDIIPLVDTDITDFFAPSKTRVAKILDELTQLVHSRKDIYTYDILYDLIKDNSDYRYVLNGYPCYAIQRMLSARSYRRDQIEKLNNQ